jgi:AcrR family transcriptional regulator
MDVSRQSAVSELRGPRARTRRLMLDTAMRLMQAGAIPSVSEVAEAAEVSRATAYRYFPSQAALVQAVVDEALGPILQWKSRATDAEARVASLLETGLPRIEEFEATFKAALKLSLDHWARYAAGTLDDEPVFSRGHRRDLLTEALSPLEGTMEPRALARLAQALSLIFGVEALVVLKDIWGLGSAETRTVALWAARALVRAGIAEAGNAKGRKRAARAS